MPWYHFKDFLHYFMIQTFLNINLLLLGSKQWDSKVWKYKFPFPESACCKMKSVWFTFTVLWSYLHKTEEHLHESIPLCGLGNFMTPDTMNWKKRGHSEILFFSISLDFKHLETHEGCGKADFEFSDVQNSVWVRNRRNSGWLTEHASSRQQKHRHAYLFCMDDACLFLQNNF